MSEEVPSSPLSSPPESVVNVRLGSPVEDDKISPISTSPVESKAETVAEPVPEAVAESIVITKQPTASPERKMDEERKSLAHDSDESAQSSLQKRKASVSNNPVSIKKPRHVAPAARKSAQDKKWEAPFVYTDSKSPLANADLRVSITFPLRHSSNVLTPIIRPFFYTHLLGTSSPQRRSRTFWPSSRMIPISWTPAPKMLVLTRPRCAMTTIFAMTALVIARILSLAGTMKSG
jgi:hypothetical protein